MTTRHLEEVMRELLEAKAEEVMRELLEAKAKEHKHGNRN